MLQSLRTCEVGPARQLSVTLAKRLNILTGDNGLGKSFLLDVCWWALTRTWAGRPASPREPRDEAERLSQKPTITYQVAGKTGAAQAVESAYSFEDQYWQLPAGRPPEPGLSVYLRVDGGFSVWDRARNERERRGASGDAPQRPPAFHLTRESLWNGLPPGPDGKIYCNGLLRDWAEWQREKGQEFTALTAVLEVLSPAGEQLRPGPMVRLSDDVRDIPTLVMDYATVPLVHASAGVQRILGLAYLLVWTFSEHERALAVQRRSESDNRLVLLIDEVEAHLHPKWQRLILPSILRAIDVLEKELAVQIIAATHAPLVLASVESLFQEDKDKLFLLELSEGAVRVDEVPWAKRGTVANWLMSIFGLQQERSLEAEQAILAAYAIMRGDTGALSADLSTREQIHAKLLQVLPGDDVFWPRWVVWYEKAAA